MRVFAPCSEVVRRLLGTRALDPEAAPEQGNVSVSTQGRGGGGRGSKTGKAKGKRTVHPTDDALAADAGKYMGSITTAYFESLQTW